MKNLVRFIAILAVATLAATQARATILAQDNFTYADGDLATVSGGTWSLFSGTSGGLNVLNNAATITGAGNKDEQISLGAGNTSSTMFAGFDATVNSWPTPGSGYFALFKDSSTFNFFARTYVTNVTGGVEFGIGTGSGVPIWSSLVTLGSTHRVVIELDQSGAFLGVNQAASLYLDGTLVGTASALINSNLDITGFALRQSNTSTEGNVVVDNLIVGTALTDVIPEPSTIMLLGVGLVSLFAIRRRS